jgi:hypothetical protein
MVVHLQQLKEQNYILLQLLTKNYSQILNLINGGSAFLIHPIIGRAFFAPIFL